MIAVLSSSLWVFVVVVVVVVAVGVFSPQPQIWSWPAFAFLVQKRDHAGRAARLRANNAACPSASTCTVPANSCVPNLQQNAHNGRCQLRRLLSYMIYTRVFSFTCESCQMRPGDSGGWTEVRRGVSVLSPPTVTLMPPPQTPLQTGVRTYSFCVTRVDVLLCGREGKKFSGALSSCRCHRLFARIV